MQGNKVLTGNIIILTHDRPIHKTNSGYLGRLRALQPERQQPGHSLRALEEVGARGEGQHPLAVLMLAQNLHYLSKRAKMIFFFLKKHKSQSTMASLPCHKNSVAKTPLNTVVFCKSTSMSVQKILPSPEACVFINPCIAKQACRKRF